MRYNPPPNWPQPPAGWSPPQGWEPDPSWGPPPAGWPVWLDDAPVYQQVQRPSVTYMPVQTNHVLHLILTLLTCTLWGWFVWLPMTVINLMRKRKIETRPY